MSRKPVRVSTSVGRAQRIASVTGLSCAASRASTGLMTYFFTAAMSSAVRLPDRMYTRAERITGRSPPAISWMHCAAESAR